jgi:hypothetical protein
MSNPARRFRTSTAVLGTLFVLTLTAYLLVVRLIIG